MSYEKMRKWNRKHPKGTRQPMLFHTEQKWGHSGSFIKKWCAYAEQLQAEGKPFLSIDELYQSQLR